MLTPVVSPPPIPPGTLPLVAQLLHRLYPATGVVHVGVGQGLGTIHQWRQWGVANALLIDAHPEPAPWVAQAQASQPGWQHHSGLVGAQTQDAAFFAASNPAESSILPPEAFHTLWPTLRALAQHTLPAQPLDALAQPATLGWKPNWLLVDCLPALPVLQGAAHTLAHCQVVWVRVALDETLPAPTHFSAVRAFLAQHHLEPVAIAEGLNPAVGEALFVRNWQHLQHASLTQAIAANEQLQNQALALEKQNADAINTIACLQAELATLQAAQQALTANNAALAAARDAEAQAKAQALAECDALAEERNSLAATRDALQTQVATQAAEHQAALDAAAQAQSQAKAEAAQANQTAQTANEQLENQALALEKHSDVASNTIANLQTELAALQAAQQALSADHIALAAAKDAEAQAKAQALAQRDEQTRLANERQQALASQQQEAANQRQRMEQLEADKHETTLRQQMLQDELIKAEAQIELIKDLLLREPGL